MTLRLLVIVCLFLIVESYPTGPPVSTCDDTLPKHGDSVPLTSPPPYHITVQKTQIKPGEIVPITVKGTTGVPFKGIFLQVREVIRSTNEVMVKPIGTYDRIVRNVKVATCVVNMDTIVHTDSDDKYSVVIDWLSPLLLKNNVVVRATILSNFSTYWTNVDSELIVVEDTDSSDIYNLEKPWLRQVVSAVKTRDDKMAAEAGVVSRFEMGFRGMIGTSDRVLASYVQEILHIEDRFGPIMYSPIYDGGVPFKPTRTSDGILKTSKSVSDLNGDADWTFNVTAVNSTGNEVMSEATRKLQEMRHYDALVQNLLAGDRQAAEEISLYLIN